MWVPALLVLVGLCLVALIMLVVFVRKPDHLDSAYVALKHFGG